jgi:ABC-2 type transport system permease protein
MHRLWAITKREFLAYFNSPVAYIVVSLFLLLVGALFWITFFAPPPSLTMRSFFNIASLVLVFYAPAVTMRLLAEENGSGTLEVLTTMPVRDIEVIAGKYLAALGLLVVTLLLTVPYGITLSSLGAIDHGPIIGGYIGLVLIGAAYMAVGLLFSSLTQHQMVAFFASMIVCLFFFFIDKFTAFMPPSLASVADYLSFDSHFQSVARGVVDTRDMVFFFSVIGLGLAAAYASLESRRWWR